APALAGLHGRPGAVLEGLARRGHGAVEVLAPRLRDLGDRLARRRVRGREALARRGGNELAVDVEVGSQELLPLELGNALLLVGGDALLGVVALEEQLLELALDRQRRFGRQVPAGLDRPLDTNHL